MRTRNTDHDSTAKLIGVVERVEKGLRVDSGVVLKAEPSLKDVCEAAIERMMLDEDSFLKRPEKRYRVHQSAIGKAWASIGITPLASLPFHEAISKTSALAPDWAQETLTRFDAISKGWIE